MKKRNFHDLIDTHKSVVVMRERIVNLIAVNLDMDEKDKFGYISGVLDSVHLCDDFIKIKHLGEIDIPADIVFKDIIVMNREAEKCENYTT